MDVRERSHDLSLSKFGIGQPVRRTEDPRLLRGEGRYTDDIKLPGQAYAVMVRSRHAHGVIEGLATEAARAMPGVLGVYTGADLDGAGFGTLKCMLPAMNRDGTAMHQPPWPALARDRVRYLGDAVACVVAETVSQAKDAAEAVEIDVDPLPAVTDAKAALLPGAPQLYDDVP